MRKLILAAASLIALAAGSMMYADLAQAAPVANGLVGASSVTNVETIQFRGVVEGLENVEGHLIGGRRYCWYPVGWHGAGWYWCGYASRRGLGWGGGAGWHGLSAPVARRGNRGVVHGRPVGGHPVGTPGGHAHGGAAHGGGHGGGHAGGGHAGGGHAGGGHAGGGKHH
jgi:hypothetical protein